VFFDQETFARQLIVGLGRVPFKQFLEQASLSGRGEAIVQTRKDRSTTCRACRPMIKNSGCRA